MKIGDNFDNLAHIMDKKDLLNSDFLKQFKSGDELNEFIHQLQKRGIEQLLEGEMDAHLGYPRIFIKIRLYPKNRIQFIIVQIVHNLHSLCL